MNSQEVFQKVRKSLVRGTNDREAHPKRWIGVLVQINTEKKVAQRLQKLGYECYVPTQFEDELVKVIKGDFKGVIGEVVRVAGQQRVGINIERLGTFVSAYIPSDFLEIV